MSTQISKPVRIAAAIGILMIVVLGGMTMMKSGSSTPSTPLPVHHVAAPAATPAHAAPAATTAAHPGAPAAPAAPAAKAAPAAHASSPAVHPAASHPVAKHAVAKQPVAKHPVAQAKPAAVPAVAANGLPGALDMLLHIHQVVVVAVYDPEVPTDKLFLAEAQAGAKLAHAGFLAVSVLDEKVAAPLTAAAGGGALLPSPGVLLYKAPDALMNVITGFIDRDAVAQAVADASTAQAPASGTPATPTTAATP